MSTFSSVEEARAFFVNDRFATLNGVRVEELFDGGALCSLEITDDHRNALGGVMGGAIFTLADLAFSVACNNDHMSTVAIDVNIHYLSGVKGTRLFARAERVKNGRTTSLFNVAVTDDTGRDIALFIGTGYKL